MDEIDRQTLAVFFCVVAVALTAGVGGQFTYAYFFDKNTASGTISAAEEFGYLGKGACIDTNDNWECDREDIPVSRSEINTFSNSSADLVIPEHVGPVVNDSIDIAANGFKTNVRVGSRSDGVTIETGSNQLQFDDATVNTSGSSLTLTTNGGDLLADDSTATADGGSVKFDAGGTVLGKNTSIDTTGSITVSGTEVTLTEGTIGGGFSSVSVDATETVTLDGTGMTDTSGSVSLTGKSVSLASTSGERAQIDTSGGVTVKATNNGGGDITAGSVDIDGGKPVKLTAAGSVTVNDGSMSTSDSLIQLKGESVEASGSRAFTESNIKLLATNSNGGAIAATGVNLTSDYGSVTLEGDDVTLPDARVDTDGSVTVSATNDAEGAIDVSEAAVSGGSQVKMTAADSLSLVDGTITTSDSLIELKAESVDVSNANVYTDSNVKLLATNGNGGTVTARESNLASDYHSITVKGNDVAASDAKIDTDGSVTVSATNDGDGSVALGGTKLTAQSQVSVTAARSLGADGANLTVTNSGSASLKGQEISASDAVVVAPGAVELLATKNDQGRVSANESRLESDHGSITLKGARAMVDQAVVETDADVSISAQAGDGGPVSATGSDISTDYGNVDLKSIGDINIEDATIRSNHGAAKASLSREEFTLYYDGIVVADSDDNLVYSPQGVKENGETSQGTVSG